jgi:GntR family transcriptional regulator/MocR family aminotransferase
LDQAGRVIYIGTFSKTFAPDLRLGFMILPPELVERLGPTLASSSSNSSIMPQRALAEFMADGKFHRHLRKTRRAYAQRREALLDWLQTEFGVNQRLTNQKGGMQVAFQLPNHALDVDLVAGLKVSGLAPEPLSRYYCKGPAKQGLLLGFTANTEEEMQSGYPTLRRALSKYF